MKIGMMGIRHFAPALCLALGAPVLAQSASSSPPSVADSERASNVRSLFRNTVDPWANLPQGPYAPSSPGDPELGEQRILTSIDGYQPFNFLLTQQAIWTDNAALTESNELSDFYSDTVLGLSYVPQVAANTYGEISANYSFYRYADHSSLDFDDLEASLGLIHVFRELNDFSVWLRYNYSRLLTARDHAELFTDHSIELGLYYPISLGPRHFAYGGWVSEFSLDGNPGYASRDEHGLMIGYQFKPRERITFDAYYRFYIHDYTDVGRTDLLQDVGIALTTHLTANIDLLLSASYSVNDSDLRGRDYEVGEAGAILSLNFQF